MSDERVDSIDFYFEICCHKGTEQLRMMNFNNLYTVTRAANNDYFHYHLICQLSI